MKKIGKFLTGAVALFLFAWMIPRAVQAEVSVNITIPLPGLIFPAPPGLIMIPGTYVYYAPVPEADIFFYEGYWYRPYGGSWYLSYGYNGPWHPAGPRVPGIVVDLWPRYRSIPHRHEVIPYNRVMDGRTWRQERYQDRRESGRYPGIVQEEYRGHDREGYGKTEQRRSGNGNGHGKKRH